MANIYTVGTDAGKNILKGMSAGTTYNARDGFTWTKNADGSATATKNGVVHNIVVAGGDSPATVSEKTSSYDQSDYLRQQKAAKLEADLASLRTAYNKSMRGYDEQAKEIPVLYTAARNDAAAQNAIAKRNFDEQAAVSGLNTGASGQAALSRSAVYRGVLAKLATEEADALNKVAGDKAALTEEYESAVRQAKSSNNADLAEALYKELIRVQGLEKQDADAERTVAANELTAHLQMGGSAAAVPDLVAKSGMSTAVISQMENYYKDLLAKEAAKASSAAAPVYDADVLLLAGMDTEGDRDAAWWQLLKDNYPEQFAAQYQQTFGGGAFGATPAIEYGSVNPTTGVRRNDAKTRQAYAERQAQNAQVAEPSPDVLGTQFGAARKVLSYPMSYGDAEQLLSAYNDTELTPFGREYLLAWVNFGGDEAAMLGTQVQNALAAAQEMVRNGVSNEGVWHELDKYTKGELTDLGLAYVLNYSGIAGR